MAKTQQSPLMALANKGALSRDRNTTEKLLDAAAIWTTWWFAVENPGSMPSPSQLRERINDAGAWARAQDSAVKHCDLATEAKTYRLAAGTQLATILDNIVVKEFTVEQAAEQIFRQTNKLSLEKTRERLRVALHWVADIKRLWTRQF